MLDSTNYQLLQLEELDQVYIADIVYSLYFAEEYQQEWVLRRNSQWQVVPLVELKEQYIYQFGIDLVVFEADKQEEDRNCYFHCKYSIIIIEI